MKFQKGNKSKQTGISNHIKFHPNHSLHFLKNGKNSWPDAEHDLDKFSYKNVAVNAKNQWIDLNQQSSNGKMARAKSQLSNIPKALILRTGRMHS